MDPKKIAEEIVKDLFNTYDLVEEKDEQGEEEEEGEEEAEDTAEENDEEMEEGEEEEDEEDEEKKPVAKAVGNAMKGAGVTAAAASISLKGQLPAAAKSSEPAHDALGGGVRDAHGKGDQVIAPVANSAAANAATLNMKPSFSASQMTNEQLSADITAIFGSENISEEFVKNAASIYEAAVASKVESITEALVEQFEEKLVEEVETVKTALVEQLDNYLAYVIQEWAKENAVAIENGLRTEIAEDFMVGLKNLFAESYVEVPQDKVNLFDELSEAVQSLEGRINEEIEKNVELHKELSILTAQKVFAEETRGLTVLQAEKARNIAENLEYSDESDFRTKVKTLVENIVTNKANKEQPKVETKVNENVTLLEQVEEPSEDVELTPQMELYYNTINRTLKG